MVDKFAIKVAKWLVSEEKDEELELKLIFVIRWIIHNSIWLIIVYILANLFSIKMGTFIFLAAYCPLREKFRGLHLKKMDYCLYVSIIIPILVGYIGTKVNIDLKYMILIYVFAYFSAFYRGVVDSPTKKLKEEQKMKFKRQGIIILTIIMLIHITVYIKGYAIVSSAMALGVFIAFANLYFGKKLM